MCIGDDLISDALFDFKPMKRLVYWGYVNMLGSASNGTCKYNIRSGAIRWQVPDFLSDGNSNAADTCQNSRLNSWTLMKVVEYNIRSYAIR